MVGQDTTVPESFPVLAQNYLEAIYSAVQSKPQNVREKIAYWQDRDDCPGKVPAFEGDLEMTLRAYEFYHLTKMGVL